MATTSILKRGFKAQAERLAKKYREELSIHPCAPLCAFKLAEHLKVPVYNATELVTTPAEIALLSGTEGKECEWSAMTMFTQIGNRIIVHNPFHSTGRQQSNLMHELAHVICDHKIAQSEYEFEIPLGMRYFNDEHEEEATCLGATLQLATPCLLWAKKRNMTIEEIAAHFNSSVEMATYRMNISGVFKRTFKKPGTAA